MKAVKKRTQNQDWSLLAKFALLTMSICSVALAGCAGLVTAKTDSAPVAPGIATQPANQSVVLGQTATFTVVATGTAPLSYQWQKNGAGIAGATSASYATPATTNADNGSTFKVVVSNTAGTMTSSAATLTVSASAVAPTITTQPTNQTVTAGQTATFTVVAAGTAPLSYQWQKNAANITGATSASYTTPATTTADNGSTFQVVVSNTAGTKTSNAATLTVNGAAVAPAITTQPTNQSVVAGQTATFTVVATGTAPLSYQWQKNAANITGATSASYTTPATTTADSGSTFQVVVSNTAGTKTSNAATLTVSASAVAPTITTQPTNQTVTAGQTATFTVVATGTAPLSYQWQKNAANITGATSASYTTPATTTADNGSTFQVVVSNTAGTKTSNAATLTVTAATTPPVLSNIVVTNIASASATITWTTDQASTTQVSYGTTTSYGSTSTLNSTLVTSHSASLTGLTASTLYHFQAQSKNAGGLTGVSADSTFTTLAASAPPPAGDTLTIQDTSGTNQTNRPVSISRPFVQGEIANFAQASIGGSAVLTQCDVKNRWPDGSLKFAIVSFIVPSLPANGTVTVSFSNQATGNNTGYLAQSDMLATGYNFEAQIKETGTSSHTISARTMLTNGSFRYWLQGPIVTAAIIEDRTTARSYDFNSDGGAGNPLHPIFEAWFYPQGNRVDVGYTVENVWAGSVVANSMRDQTYSVVLTSGQTTPVTVFTQASFNHIGRSRWYQDFWNGNAAPPAIRINHNLPYLTQTKVIPNYDTSLVLDNALVSYEYSQWGGSNQPLTSGGNIPVDMNAGGAADTIGLMTKWETMYLMTMGTDDRMLAMTLGNAQLEGRVPYHYREADTNLFFDTGNTVNAFGHVTSINARPMENVGIGFNADFNDNCSGANTQTFNLGTVTADNWDSNGMDSSHWPEFGFVAYLITGKYYYMEETAFAGSYMTAWSGGCPGARRDGAAGVLDQPQPGRGVAWSFRAATHAWLSSPDGTPEQAYFYDKLENSIASFEGNHAIAISDPTRQAVWNWGNSSDNMDPDGPSPLHFWNEGDPSFIESPLRTDGYVAYAWSPWEESYLFSVFGMGRDAGLDHVGDLLAWGANRWFHLALDTTNVNNIYLVGAYRFPTKITSTNNWLTNYAEYLTAYQGNGDGLPTSWTFFWPCDYAPDDDKRYEGMATIGFLYPYTADGFSGQTAWNTVQQSMWNTSGCLPADFQNGSNASPKWDILARTH